MLSQPIQSVVVLSSGSDWNPPSILPLVGDTWPAGSTANAVFYNSAGATLANVPGTVTPGAVDFSVQHAALDAVPAGAMFEKFVTTSDGRPHKIRYGTVFRKEARFPNAPANTQVAQALQYADTLQRTALGANWVPLSGSTQLYNNTSLSLPYGAAAVDNLLVAESSAIRWFTPLNTDSVSVNVNMLNQNGTGIGGPRTGTCAIVVCGDINFNTYLAVQFDEPNHLIHMCVGSGPVTVTYQGTAIANTLVNGDNYTITYNNATKTLAVYKGTSTSPLGTFVDTGSVVPHGPGYRYAGFGWNNGQNSPGLQVSGWSAQDGII